MSIYKFEINSIQEEQLKRFLEENNMKYEIYPSPLHMFFEEEAEFRIRLNFEDELTPEELDEIIEEYQEDLALEFFDREGVLDCDLLDDITRDTVKVDI